MELNNNLFKNNIDNDLLKNNINNNLLKNNIDIDLFKNNINNNLFKNNINTDLFKNSIDNDLFKNKKFNLIKENLTEKDVNNIVLSQMKLLSYSIEYNNELFEPDILTILQLQDKIVINNYDCYYIAIRFFNFNHIEISFYEEYYEIDDINDKGRFQIGIIDNPEWQDYFTINDRLLYPDSEYVIKDTEFICKTIYELSSYIVQAIKLYKEFLLKNI